MALQNTDWATQVEWKSGDALKSESYKEFLQDSDAVVVSIGSPPLPTTSQKDMEMQINQRRMNWSYPAM